MPVLIGEQSQTKNILIIPNTTNYQYILALKYLSTAELFILILPFLRENAAEFENIIK